MNTADLVRELTKKGVLVTPEVLRKIKSGELTEASAAEQPAGKDGFMVSVSAPETQAAMTPADYVSYYNSRYESLRDILLRKMRASSISNARASFSETSIIAMVREKTASGCLLEDTTGEIEASGTTDASEDDVIGVTGTVKEGRMFISEAVWPDIPLSNKPSSIDGLSLFLTHSQTRPAQADKDAFVILTHEPESIQDEDMARTVVVSSSTSRIDISRGDETFRILAYRPGRTVGPADAKAMLRKRHLGTGPTEAFSKKDPYVIDPAPDIFWLISDSSHIERYKGVTIVITKPNDILFFNTQNSDANFLGPQDSAAPEQATD
jgi:DNA polymerase II small subunit/DNA polymerase delta subunit B